MIIFTYLHGFVLGFLCIISSMMLGSFSILLTAASAMLRTHSKWSINLINDCVMK